MRPTVLEKRAYGLSSYSALGYDDRRVLPYRISVWMTFRTDP